MDVCRPPLVGLFGRPAGPLAGQLKGHPARPDKCHLATLGRRDSPRPPGLGRPAFPDSGRALLALGKHRLATTMMTGARRMMARSPLNSDAPRKVVKCKLAQWLTSCHRIGQQPSRRRRPL